MKNKSKFDALITESENSKLSILAVALVTLTALGILIIGSGGIFFPKFGFVISVLTSMTNIASLIVIGNKRYRFKPIWLTGIAGGELIISSFFTYFTTEFFIWYLKNGFGFEV
jgi:hypothetical protein